HPPGLVAVTSRYLPSGPATSSTSADRPNEDSQRRQGPRPAPDPGPSLHTRTTTAADSAAHVNPRVPHLAAGRVGSSTPSPYPGPKGQSGPCRQAHAQGQPGTRGE